MEYVEGVFRSLIRSLKLVGSLKLSSFLHAPDAKSSTPASFSSPSTKLLSQTAGEEEMTVQMMRNEVRGDERISRSVLLSLEER